MRENVRRDDNIYQLCVFDLPRLRSFHGQMILKTCKLSCTWTHNKTSLLIDFVSAHLTISLSCISKSGQPRLQWHLPYPWGSPSPASEKRQNRALLKGEAISLRHRVRALEETPDYFCPLTFQFSWITKVQVSWVPGAIIQSDKSPGLDCLLGQWLIPSLSGRSRGRGPVVPKVTMS